VTWCGSTRNSYRLLPKPEKEKIGQPELCQRDAVTGLCVGDFPRKRGAWEITVASPFKVSRHLLERLKLGNGAPGIVNLQQML